MEDGGEWRKGFTSPLASKRDVSRGQCLHLLRLLVLYITTSFVVLLDC